MPRKSKKAAAQQLETPAIATPEPPQPPEPPKTPDPDRNGQPERRPVSWAETVRSHESYGATGVHRVETRSPDKTGIRFEDDKPPTAEEKQFMQKNGLGYWPEAKVWAKRATPDARDETKALAERIAQRRRQEQAEERDR
jgi:hypothetical protein